MGADEAVTMDAAILLELRMKLAGGEETIPTLADTLIRLRQTSGLSVRQLEEAKTQETRDRRISKIVMEVGK